MDNLNKNLFIHPGFLKTATKTLQEHFFGVHPDIQSLGYPHDDHRKTQLSEALRRIDGVNYSDSHVQAILNDLINREPQNKTIVFSDETMLANAYLRAPIADRLHNFFPEAQIILTIRHQFSAIQSFYARHGRILFNSPKPYGNRSVTLENWIEHAYKNYQTSFLGSVDYWSSIRIYEKIFGADRIHVFLFEDFVQNKSQFIDCLCQLLRIDPETGKRVLENQHRHDRQSIRFQHYTNFRQRFPIPFSAIFKLPGAVQLRNQWHQFIARGKKASPQVPDEWRKTLSGSYREGNAFLAKQYALPLEKYDYPL